MSPEVLIGFESMVPGASIRLRIWGFGIVTVVVARATGSPDQQLPHGEGLEKPGSN